MVTQKEGELSYITTLKSSFHYPLLKDFFFVTKKKVVKISSNSCVNFGFFTGQLDNRAHTDNSFYVLGTEHIAHTNSAVGPCRLLENICTLTVNY